MNAITATEAREKLYRLLDETAVTHKSVLITGRRANAVLVAEEEQIPCGNDRKKDGADSLRE